MPKATVHCYCSCIYKVWEWFVTVPDLRTDPGRANGCLRANPGKGVHLHPGAREIHPMSSGFLHHLHQIAESSPQSFKDVISTPLILLGFVVQQPFEGVFVVLCHLAHLCQSCFS